VEAFTKGGGDIGERNGEELTIDMSPPTLPSKRTLELIRSSRNISEQKFEGEIEWERERAREDH